MGVRCEERALLRRCGVLAILYVRLEWPLVREVRPDRNGAPAGSAE